MIIKDVEAVPLVCRLPSPFQGGTYTIENRYCLITRIYTDEGIVAETFAGDPQTNQQQIISLINNNFRKELIGEDPTRIEKIWHKLFGMTVSGGGSVKFEAINALDMGLRATIMQAISAVDIALWDLLGKKSSLPLYKLLGGYRDEIPIIVIGGYYQKEKGDEGLIRELLDYKKEGFAGVKMKVGRASVEEDARRVKVAREATDFDFVIACDANQAWTPEQAIKFGKLVREFDVAWLEEPVHWYDQTRALQMVRRSTGIPINAGQGEISRFGCRELVENEAVDILNVDCSIAGGITEWRKIADFAALHYVRMGHHEEWQVAIHLLASITHGLYIECFPDPLRDPLWNELPKDRPSIRGGLMKLPEKPGVGIELNKSTIQKYTVKY